MSVKAVRNYSFIDVGNSTIKVCNNGMDVEKHSLIKLNKILKKGIQSEKCFIFNTNTKRSVSKKLEKLEKKLGSVKVVKATDLANLVATDEIDINSVGIDILLSVYYLNLTDDSYTLINSGTYLWSVFVKDKMITSVNIDVGFTTRIKAVKKEFKIHKNNPEWSWICKNTHQAFYGSILKDLYGIYNFYINRFPNIRQTRYISGNDLTDEMVTTFKEYMDTNKIDNISLMGLMTFVDNQNL